ncbi:MAG: hypothetical protein ABIT10_05280 [Alteraurantiacibacter sp.]
MDKTQFSLGLVVERWFRPWPMQLAWFLLIALVTRYTVLGDPNYHDDESLFFLIGQRMHDGFVPYVDIWDRKGPGLFVLFWLFAGISDSVLAYQIPALAFAALTAFVLARIAYLYTGRMGALLAGTFYLVLLPRVLGGGGQAGVWFNLLTVVAAWLVLSRTVAKVPTRASVGAMLLCGVAITFKQTCLFDGAFLGLVLLWQHHRAGADRAQLFKAAALYCAVGAAPMTLAAGIYLAIGHFPELWHAMVLSNLDKDYNPTSDIGGRVVAMLVVLAPLLPFAVFGLAKRLDYQGKTAPRLILGGWLLATLLALAAIPNFIDHYLLPVIVVLPLCAAPTLQREPFGAVLGAFGIVLIAAFGPQFDLPHRQESRHAISQLTAEILASEPAPRLFVFQGPVALYATTGLNPPTPLAFPLHLEALPERNVSHLDTATEVRRVLAWQPTTVITLHTQRRLVNPETRDLVMPWVRAHCRTRSTRNLPNRYGDRLFDVWSNCSVR